MPEPLSPAEREALRLAFECNRVDLADGDYWEAVAKMARIALAAVPSLGHEAGEREVDGGIFGPWLTSTVARCPGDDCCSVTFWYSDGLLRCKVCNTPAHVAAVRTATPPGRSMPTGGGD